MRHLASKSLFSQGMAIAFLLVCVFLFSLPVTGEQLFDPDGFLVLRVPAAKGFPLKAGTTPDEALRQSVYVGGETLRFAVSWLGVRAGELIMRTSKVRGAQDTFTLEVVARSAGVLDVLYPIEDHFTTVVYGPHRLPSRQTMEQKEGRRVNSKLTTYDQDNFVVSYRKNDAPPEIYQLDGPAHNEFSSFFIMRTLPFSGDESMVVPTFADKKRHEVTIVVEGREEQEGVLGKKTAIKVQPRLKFKGLYDKVGDPLIWLTDDLWRVPTRIQAKIIIGSLTAELIEYSGPAGNFAVPGTGKESPRPPPAHTP